MISLRSFKADDLVTELFAEVRAFAAASFWSESGEALELTEDERFARSVAEAPLPDASLLSQVITEVFWASMLREEARPTSPRVTFSTGLPAPTHKFQSPKVLTAESLRKLSPLHGARDYLIWEIINGKPSLTGLDIHPPGRVPRHPSVMVAATGTGALDLSWDSVRLLTFRSGQIMRRSVARLSDLREVIQSIVRILGSSHLSSAAGIVEAIQNQGHGGALWIARDATSLDDVDIGTELHDAGGLRDQFPKVGADPDYDPWVRSVARLASVDGAVLVDSRVRVIGFGAFIHRLNAQQPAFMRVHGGAVVPIVSADHQGWGGRHRSALAFCARNAPAAAFVVSEDGGVTAFIADRKGEPVLCEPVVSLGVYL